MESVTMRTKQTDSGIDVSMNSPGDLTLSFAGDRTSTDLGLLDLDSVLPDDDESWLYGPSATAPSSDTSDLIAWLQNAAATLEPKQRRALSQKLENIAKKKQVTDRELDLGLDPTDSLLAEIDGLLTESSPPPPSPPPQQQQNVRQAQQNVQQQQLQRRDSAGSDDTEFYDAASDLDSTDPSLLVRTSTPELGSSEEAMKLAAQTRAGDNKPTLALKPKMVTLQSPTELSTPDFVSAEEKMLGRVPMTTSIPPNASLLRPKSPAATVDGLIPSAVKIHPELHPDLQDIQLLASMQEEDLRKALEKLQQQRQRKASQNSDHSNGGAAANGGRRPTGQNSNANMDRFDALAKEVNNMQLQQQQTRDSLAPTPGRLAQQQPRRSLETRAGISTRAKSPKPLNSFPSNLNGASLQKSLPNLASSRSAEFANRQNPEAQCEQGSCNDITDRVSPVASAAAVTPAAKKSGLRQPTPRRVAGGVGVRSGIPSPSPARTAIPMPTSAIKRPGTVGNGRLSAAQPAAPSSAGGQMGGGRAQPQQQPVDDSWKDDCF